MSAIFGIINLDGQPLNKDHLDMILRTLKHRGPDDSGIVIDGEASFGHLMFHTTTESLKEKLPYHDKTSNLIITGDIRLDNREELLIRLGINNSNLVIPDSQIILKAFKKWGRGMPNYIEGEYVIVIWYCTKKKLLIFTDPASTRPVFYYYTKKLFIFATEIKGILAVHGIPKELNKKFLAASLSIPGVIHITPEATYFKGISAMPAASTMILDSRGMKIDRHWAPDITKTLKFKNENEWTEAFQELFFKVVEARMRSAFPVASLLSGGLDSSAITSFALELQRKQGKRLRTFSAVLPEGYRGTGTDERYYIDLFKKYDNIDMQYIIDKHRGPFDDPESLVHGGESPFYTSRHFLYSAFSDAAKEQGIRNILDGCLGEMGPSFHSEGCLSDFFIKGRLLKLLKEIKFKSEVEKKKKLSIIKGDLIKHLLPTWLQSKVVPRFDISQMSNNFPIQKNFVDTWIDETEIEGITKELQSLLYSYPFHRRNQARLFQRKRRCLSNAGFNGYENIVISYPFTDRRIIEFCLASPNWMKIHNGYKRYMIRAGMRGLAPDEIRWRTTKEPFSPDFHDRYNRQKKIAENLFYSIDKNDPVREIIDIERIKKELSYNMIDNRCGTHKGFMTMHVIPRTVYLCYFLRQFDEYKK